jgi:hypothetical protein
MRDGRRLGLIQDAGLGQKAFQPWAHLGRRIESGHKGFPLLIVQLDDAARRRQPEIELFGGIGRANAASVKSD